eukprot:m.102617 g.102617  ORF g.102617 m.102617 type:complete len:66 (-) comp27422_c0_seq1:43-240(-)
MSFVNGNQATCVVTSSQLKLVAILIMEIHTDRFHLRVVRVTNIIDVSTSKTSSQIRCARDEDRYL